MPWLAYNIANPIKELTPLQLIFFMSLSHLKYQIENQTDSYILYGFFLTVYWIFMRIEIQNKPNRLDRLDIGAVRL